MKQIFVALTASVNFLFSDAAKLSFQSGAIEAHGYTVNSAAESNSSAPHHHIAPLGSNYADGTINKAIDTCKNHPISLAVWHWLQNHNYSTNAMNQRIDLDSKLCEQIWQQEVHNVNCYNGLKQMTGIGLNSGRSALFNLMAKCNTDRMFTCRDFGYIDGCAEDMTLFDSWDITCGKDCQQATCCIFKKDECVQETHNCHVHAYCVDTASSFTCSCSRGYTGDGIGCYDLDECTQPGICGQSGAQCRNSEGSFICGCFGDDNLPHPGLTYRDQSCQDNDECVKGTHNCHGQAQCVNVYGSFNCVCAGGWIGNGTHCTPQGCDASFPPQNGRPGDCGAWLQSGTTCSPTCDEGFTLSAPTSCTYGVLVRSSCDRIVCDASEPPQYGQIGDCTTYLPSGAECTPTCNRGFEADGTTKCDGGVLVRTKCLYHKCDVPQPRNGYMGNCSARLTENQECQFTCEGGHFLDRNTKCKAGHLSMGKCIPNPCNITNHPVNGKAGDCPAILDHQGVCRPECNEGYTVSGFTQCAHGLLRAAFCFPNNCRVRKPKNGDFGACGPLLMHRQTCIFKCDPGYRRIGHAHCDKGLLSEFYCEPLPCNVTEAPANGYKGDCCDHLDSGGSCQFTCKDRYRSTGRTSCHAGELRPARCEPEPCDASLPPVNGARGTCNEILGHGARCHPTCNDGYALSGETSCDLGLLTSATCLPKNCDSSHPPENGEIGNCQPNLAHNGTCMPQCNHGYAANASTSCNLGVLSPTMCEPEPCQLVVPPENGNLGPCGLLNGVLKSGDECTPWCHHGYQLTNPFKCCKGTLELAFCKRPPCDASKAPEHGRQGNCGTALPHGASCQIACDPGYMVSGQTSCKAGVLIEARCVPVSCELEPPENGHLGACQTKIGVGEICLPECNRGYTADQPTHCKDGVVQKTSCKPQLCHQSVPPRFGKLGNCTFRLEHGQVCTPTCLESYYLKKQAKCMFGNYYAGECEACAVTEIRNGRFVGDDCMCMSDNSDGRGQFKLGVQSAFVCASTCGSYNAPFYAYQHSDGRCECKNGQSNSQHFGGWTSGQTCYQKIVGRNTPVSLLSTSFRGQKERRIKLDDKTDIVLHPDHFS